MGFPSHIGANLDLTKIRKSRLDETLFGETSASVLITFESENANQVKALCDKHNLEFNPIGNTIGEKSISINGLGSIANLDSLEDKYESALVKVFE